MKVSVSIALCALAILGMANGAYGDSRLLYVEAQAVGSYTFYRHPHPGYLNEFGWYSMDQMDVMQKPSLGFDLVQRLSGEAGDWGMLAVQGRFAFDKTHNGYIEPQLYNAYLKVKPGFGDLWIGHNKPAFGLSMSLDNHGALLQPLSMSGYGFDRDWGAGYYRDFESGNAAFSATLGSGMPIHIDRNYLLSGRISKGDLNQQNWNAGLSASYGKVLETMGYHLPWWDRPIEQIMAGCDGSLFMGHWEHRVEVLWFGRAYGYYTDSIMASPRVFFHRSTLNLMAENRLKLEIQGVWTFESVKEYELDFGATFQVTPDLAIRGYFMGRNRPSAVAQIYWYHKL